MYETAHCIDCGHEYSLAEIVKAMGTDENDVNIPHCEKCNGYVKPDIVMFGEVLPETFSKCVKKDLTKGSDCKVFIVMGTSLTVHPVATLPSLAPHGSTRALLNREKVGPFSHNEGYVQEVGDESTHLDLFIGGDDMSIDDAVDRLCEVLGWSDELEELVQQGPIDLVGRSRHEATSDDE